MTQQDHDFLIAFGAFQQNVHINAVRHGLWTEPRNVYDCISIVKNELSEAQEALKKGNPDDKGCPEYTNLEIELADVVLSVMSVAKGE